MYTIKNPLKIISDTELGVLMDSNTTAGDEFVSKEIAVELLEALKGLMENLKTNVNLTNDSILHIGHRFDTLKKASKAITNAEK